MIAPVRKPAATFEEIDMFFAGQGEVHQTMHRLVGRLKRARIPYAVMGGMAVNAHGHDRLTKDVDILLSRDGFSIFRELFVPRAYEPITGFSRRFLDRKNQRRVDILVAGLFPGNGKPGPIVFPDPEQVGEAIKKIQYVNLSTLIQLKLAARRHQDFADVVNLIALHNLDESFQGRLHPTLHNDYIECLEEKRREDEYLAREG